MHRARPSPEYGKIRCVMPISTDPTMPQRQKNTADNKHTNPDVWMMLWIVWLVWWWSNYVPAPMWRAHSMHLELREACHGGMWLGPAQTYRIVWIGGQAYDVIQRTYCMDSTTVFFNAQENTVNMLHVSKSIKSCCSNRLKLQRCTWVRPCVIVAPPGPSSSRTTWFSLSKS